MGFYIGITGYVMKEEVASRRANFSNTTRKINDRDGCSYLLPEIWTLINPPEMNPSIESYRKKGIRV